MANVEQDEITPGLRVGSLIGGKYRVQKSIGSGGMGVVVQALHVELREPVAIKILLQEVSQHPEAAARFLREARAAARLRSPHVARSSDVGTLESGQKYMVMEYLHGSDLAAILIERGRLPIRQAIEYVLQACDAVAEAHQLGIIHRDLKPANLFVVRQSDGSEHIKVLDFGISKAVDLHSSNNTHLVTRSQSMIGTPVYASPEQLMSAADVDERTDIWALGGVVLYELLSGVPPFTGNTIEELVAHVVASDPLPLRTVRNDVSPEIERIVMACLHKDRNYRYATIVDLVEALTAVSGSGIDEESRVLASRIVRRRRSGAPPTPEHAPTQLAVSDRSSPNQASITPAPNGPTPAQGSLAADTRVSGTERRAVKSSNSTYAGLYSSRPITLGEERRSSKRTWTLGILVLAVLGTVIGVFGFRHSGESRAAAASNRGIELASPPTATTVAELSTANASIEVAPVVSVPEATRVPPSASPKLQVSTNSFKAVQQAPPTPSSNAKDSNAARQDSLPAIDRHGFAPSQSQPSTKTVTDFGPRR